MTDVLAVILGGGAGTRLYPLTKFRSKPAVPLGGKYRLVDVPISSCINSEIDRIFVLTQYNSASLNRHISTAYRFDSFRRGFVSVLAAEQTQSSKKWYQGTADAVRQCMPHLNNQDYSHALILSGDQLYSMDYRRLFAHQEATKADITIGTIPVTATDASGFGIMKTDEEGIIQEFYEKPAPEHLAGKESNVSSDLQAEGRVYLASMGIYLFKGEILKDLLLGAPDDHDFGKQIIPAAIHRYRVASYPFTGYWSDIGTVHSFYEANLMLARPAPPFSLYDKMAPLYTNARMLPPAKIHHSMIEDSLISEGSVITRSTITRSVIGLRSFIKEGARVTDSIVLGYENFAWLDQHAGIGENTVIEKAIIDKNVKIGKHCRITNKDHVVEGEREGMFIKDGIIVITKAAQIPDNTVI